MKQITRRLRNVILILIAAAVIAGGTIYLVYTTITARRSTVAQIDDLLAEADYEISLGYFARALESLDKALAQARGEYNSLRILKRVYQISYNLNDFTVLNRFARTAAGHIPGSRELTEIYLYASIRSESSQRAIDLLRRSRGNLSSLRAEAYLSGMLDTPPGSDNDPVLTKILSLVEQKAAGPRDSFQLQRLGTDLDEPRIHLDAALLWMEQGDAESAFTVVNRHIGDPLFREPSIYISYDAGYEQTALSLLREIGEEAGSAQRVDLRIMEADLQLILGDSSEAMHLYREVISSHPAYSWTPYLNLAQIAGQNGDRQTAFAFRERAYGQYPDVGAVLLSYARSLSEIGDRKRAAEILQSYLEEHEDDYQAQLYLLDVQNTASFPAVYQAALWKLYNRHPESRMLCEQLFLYLLQFNDLSGAEAVLRHYQLATGRTQEPWLLDYRAILAAVRRDDAEAIRLLQDRLVLEDSWQACFNLAVLLGKSRKSRQAIEQLIEAENLLPEERKQYYRSRIRSRIGEQYLLLGDLAAARRECEYAVDLDVSNFHAHRILRILERE